MNRRFGDCFRTKGEVSMVNLQLGRDNKVLNIATIQIRPNRTQPRRNFDEEQLRSLSRSIVENGKIGRAHV